MGSLNDAGRGNMANGEPIYARITLMTHNRVQPPTLQIEVMWVLPIEINPHPTQGTFQTTVDATLNENQITNAIQVALAAHISEMTGLLYPPVDCLGCGL